MGYQLKIPGVDIPNYPGVQTKYELPTRGVIADGVLFPIPEIGGLNKGS